MDSADSAFAYCLSEKTPSYIIRYRGCLLSVFAFNRAFCGYRSTPVPLRTDRTEPPQTADIAGFRNAGRQSLAVGNVHCLRFIRRLGLCFRLGRRNLAVRDVLRRLQRIKQRRLIRNVNRRLRIGIGSRFRVRLVVTAAAGFLAVGDG